MSQSVKLVVFDLDGTLVDAYHAVARSLNHALNKVGYPPIDDYTIQRSVGWGEKVLVRKFVHKDDLDKTLSIYRKHHRVALKNGTKFLPGALRTLKKLRKQKYKLAIASNRPTPFTKIILKYLKIDHYFDCVLCADKVARPKPAKDILIGIMDKLKLKPSEVIYVGDMTIDVQTGTRARVRTIAVVTGSCTRKELAEYGPYKILKNISTVPDILAKMNGQIAGKRRVTKKQVKAKA